MTKREQVLESSEQSEEQNDKTPRVRLNQELQDMIFLVSSWNFLHRTKYIQSEYVRRQTKHNGMYEAAIKGDIMNIKWLMRRGFKLGANVFRAAGGYKGANSIKNLDWLKSQNCPYGKNIFHNAIETKAFENMIWINKNIIKWNEYDIGYAAKYSGFDMVKFMYVNGCQWDKNTFNCLIFFKNISLEQIEWLHTNGCPVPDDEWINYVIVNFTILMY
jgi:hypothetical protein